MCFDFYCLLGSAHRPGGFCWVPKGSVPQACVPWRSQPLVLGSFRPIDLNVEMLFVFPKALVISISKLQEKSYTPWPVGGGRWCLVSPATWTAVTPPQGG